MDTILDAHLAMTLGAWLLLQILTSHDTVCLPLLAVEEEEATDTFCDIMETLGQPVEDPLAVVRSGLHNFRLSTSLYVLPDDLGFRVKPRSTTWFLKFLLSEYDNARWLQMFRMSKRSKFSLADLLTPYVRKKDTKYRLAIPVVIRVACTLFKLTHGASLFICSKMFALGKSTVCSVLRDVVHAINVSLRHNICWPTSDCLRLTQQKFVDLCSLPGVVGAIDGTHILISKPCHVPADYFYFKSGGYTLNCQAVVDSEKRFLDLYLGMPGSTNDSRMLKHSSLYELAMHNNLFDNPYSSEGFSLYLLGNHGYPLLPWLMVPHRTQIRLSMAKALFNKKLRKGRCVVENAFGILRQTFRELLTKSDLDVVFLPDVIVCCAILYNILLDQSHEEVENFIQILWTEGLHGEVIDDVAGELEVGEGIPENVAGAMATEKKRLLGLHLSMQRQQIL